MSINFAAANMAGYNNPQIEVFEAVLGETGVEQFPKKSVISDCINRGAIPFILVTFGSSYQPSYLLPLSFINLETDAFYFCGVDNSDASIVNVTSICYNSNESNPPEFRHNSITIT